MTVRRVDVGPVELCCDIRGEGRPIVFIHGNALTHRSWLHQLEHFAKNYQVIAPDLRGHGDSDKPEGSYPISYFVTDVIGLLDALHIDRAVLAGHSMGGRVALSAALQYPERVTALVLVNTSATPFSRAHKQIDQVRTLGLELELKEFIDFLSSSETPETLKQEILNEELKTPERVRVELWRTVSTFDVSGRLREIDKPVLIIVGELDQGTPMADSQRLHASVRGSTLVTVPEVAHFTMLERPGIVNRCIEDFLRKVVDSQYVSH